MGQIRVSGLGKAYKQYPNRWSRLFEWLVPFSPPRHHLHWILREVEFTIEPGEAVGIVGVNGAGKSTLLKMIAGTTQPTCGEIRVAGRVAALLELGMGFHPDFTGRQNVFMAGQLLGMQVEEIQALMPEIEAFAEIAEAIEQPVRTYSSGMQMRLAFSVATARRPDILIVDEALSVGDAYFQHKSFERIRSFRKAGTTLLIVSHDRSAIQSICDSAILLEQGRMAMRGRPEEVMDYYNALLAEREGQTVRQEMLADGQVRTISGTGEAAILDVRMVDQRQRALEVVEVGQAVTLEVEVEVRQDIERLILGFMIKDRLGQPMYGINTHRLDKALTDLKAGERITYRFAFDMRLGKGHYSVALSLSRLDSHLDRNFEWRDYGLVFHVINNRQEDFVGCSWLGAETHISRSGEAALDPTSAESTTDSQAIADEAQAYFGLPRERFVVAPLGHAARFRPRDRESLREPLRAHGLVPRGYFLCVGTLEPRKNLSLALRAHGQLPAAVRQRFPLMIVGMPGWESRSLDDELRQALASGTVRLLGYLPDERVAELMSGARALVFPSIYEGFGLPVLEAMASGTPVLLTRLSAMPEVAGEAGSYIDPDDANGLSDMLVRMTEDTVYWECCREAGLRRAEQFSWKRCANLTAAAYRRAVEG